MKNPHISRLAFLALALALMVPKTFAIDLNSLPRLADQEDSPDLEDEDDPCNPPAANDGPNGDGSPCEKNTAPGMAVWRVSQPYINLWLHDTPMRYRLGSGQWMELNLSYKQRGETREEFIAGFGPGWSCNWIGLAVRSNAYPDSIFLHKAGGGREILTPGEQSPRTLGQTVCLVAPCPWDGSFWISSPSGSSRNYSTALCSPDTNLITYLFRSFSADGYGRATIYNWAGYQPGGTCYARLNTVAHIALIQRNAIQSWTLLPEVEVILLGEEIGLAEAARELGGQHIPQVERNSNDVPLISSMFKLARENSNSDLLCIINADMVLMPDFVEAAKQAMKLKDKLVLLSRRWDYDTTESIGFAAGWESQLRERVRKQNRPHRPAGSDFFLFPKSCYTDIPNFIIGRAGWDNWMIYKARKEGWSVMTVRRPS